MTKILVLEDSITQAVKLQYALEQAGYEVDLAKNGAVGLEMIRENPPDLIISDIIMPQMDGYEFCRAVKSDPEIKDIPVMLLTSLTDPQDVIGGLECGADNFLTKPYKEEVILSRLKYMLINKELRRAQSSSIDLEIYFAGKKHRINSERVQILDLLFSSFENAIQKNEDLERVINELKETQSQLEFEKERAESATQAKSEFLGIAAHDMKNPLSGIMGLAEMLKMDLDEGKLEDAAEVLGLISKSAGGMIEVVNDILNTEAIEAGKVTMKKSLVDLSHILDEVVAMNKPRAKSKSIDLLITAESIQLSVDHSKVKEAMDNLVNNAVKYSPSGKQVEVSLKNDGSRVLFAVKDQGPGLSSEDKSKLFQRFSRLSPKPTGGETSTGLGLSIVKSLIDLHDGEVWCESKEGEGSTFLFALPKDQEI